MKKSVVIAFAVASLVCLLFVAISLATPVWLEITVPVIPFVTKTVATYGLFEYCRDDELAVWVCVDQTSSEIPDYVEAVQAFLIMAAILLLFQTIYCLLVAKKKAHCRGIPALFLISGVFIMIAMATYTAELNASTNIPLPPIFVSVSTNNRFDQYSSYGYSFWLGWVSMVVTIILAVISAVMARISNYSHSVLT